MRALWLSRHKLSWEQLTDLRTLYGKDLEIKHVDRTVSKYQEVLEFGKDCDILAVVLPVQVLALLTDPSINTKPVIQSVSSRQPTGHRNWNPDSHFMESIYSFRHEYWIQVMNVQVRRLD